MNLLTNKHLKQCNWERSSLIYQYGSSSVHQQWNPIFCKMRCQGWILVAHMWRGHWMELCKFLQMGYGWNHPHFFVQYPKQPGISLLFLYAQAPRDHLPEHFFWKLTPKHNQNFKHCHKLMHKHSNLTHMFEVYVDDFVGVVVPHSQDKLTHLSCSVFCIPCMMCFQQAKTRFQKTQSP